MKMPQQISKFKDLGIDIKRYTYAECVDELIERYKILLDDKRIQDKDVLERSLFNINNYPN